MEYRYIRELDKSVPVDKDGVNILSNKDATWLAVRDAWRDMAQDDDLRGQRLAFAGTAYVRDDLGRTMKCAAGSDEP